MSKTHWKSLINPDYLGAYSLPEGEDLTVTIMHISRQEVVGEGGKTEVCTVAEIKGRKPMILNRTNQKSIQKLYGPYIEDWAGKEITLYASITKLKGEMVECLRIRGEVARKPTLSEERLNKALAAIAKGEYKKDELLLKFKLTPEQLQRVEKGVSSAD